MTFAAFPFHAVLIGVVSLGLACSDKPEPHPPPPVEPWDGTYTPLVEPSDWVDRGVFAPCSFTPPVGTPIDCDNPALFDLSKCDTATLDSLDPHGIYQVDMRHDSGVSDFAGFRVPVDGSTGSVNVGYTLPTSLIRQQLKGSFLLSARFTFPTGFLHSVFAGCGVSGPGTVTGCFAQCSGRKFLSSGTFEASRMTWGRGESESSGGLRLVSETHVQTHRPADVFVHRKHAYVMSIDDSATKTPGGLSVVDVSDPTHPVIKKKITIPGDSYWNAAWAKDDALYVASKAKGVIVFDISNPADPVFVRSLPTGAPLNVHTLFVDGNRLYAVSPAPAATGETLIFDISSPLEPVLLNRLVTPDEVSWFPSAHDSFAYQDRLYVNQYATGYVVFDVKDAQNPRQLGRYTFSVDGREPMSHASAVGTFAGKTIAFEGGEGTGAHLRVLDVTDPANIQLIGRYKLRPQTSIHNVILKDTLLYIAYYHEGLRVLDVSNPTQPREVAYFNTYRESDPGRSESILDGAIGIRVPGDGYVYLVDLARGLLILNEL
ncbi:hypothetical protein MYSTI_01981 [Myxococcus stipitatus DSM 14675]|uniref:Uncharacterized protein n=1 Tax=Myxococcus stipitatus (strain DSM 14675 / JCM 12634 / Mx s8) TaxID=1278073 RepID=L7U627_MYXSD|nr:hypothetical protein [Myxococcus stipitatus]AGC43310.1 hypothetical protein MYSTI_01981 [Myxococcus stipitatus DSM 14675]